MSLPPFLVKLEERERAEARALIASQSPEDQHGFDRDGRRKAQRGAAVTNLAEQLDEYDGRIVRIRL